MRKISAAVYIMQRQVFLREILLLLLYVGGGFTSKYYSKSQNYEPATYEHTHIKTYLLSELIF